MTNPRNACVSPFQGGKRGAQSPATFLGVGPTRSSCPLVASQQQKRRSPLGLRIPKACTPRERRWGERDPRGRLSYLSLVFFGTPHSNGFIVAFLLCFFTSLLFTAICKAYSVILLFFFISFGEHYRDKLLQVFLNKKSITKFGPFLLLIYPRDSFKNSNSFKVCLSLTLLENRKIFPQHFVLLKIAYHTDLPFPI